MSAPFAGPPALASAATSAAGLDAALAALDPPRRHYTHFFAIPARTPTCCRAAGAAAFLRGYFHVKGGDFAANAQSPSAR